MDATLKSALTAAVGVVLGAGLTGITVFLNGWLQRQWDKERWSRERKENAYIEALNKLTLSQRKPVKYTKSDGQLVKPERADEGDAFVEKVSYDGAMASLQHVPTWMTMVQAYSSETARDKIKPFRERITRVFRQLKTSEQTAWPAPTGEKMIEVGEMSQAIEGALDVIIACSEIELVGKRCLLQKLFRCST